MHLFLQEAFPHPLGQGLANSFSPNVQKVNIFGFTCEPPMISLTQSLLLLLPFKNVQNLLSSGAKWFVGHCVPRQGTWPLFHHLQQPPHCVEKSRTEFWERRPQNLCRPQHWLVLIFQISSDLHPPVLYSSWENKVSTETSDATIRSTVGVLDRLWQLGLPGI